MHLRVKNKIKYLPRKRFIFKFFDIFNELIALEKQRYINEICNEIPILSVLVVNEIEKNKKTEKCNSFFFTLYYSFL